MHCWYQTVTKIGQHVISTPLKKMSVWIALLIWATAVRAYELNIAHINDHHSNMRPTTATIVVDGKPVMVSMGGFARLATAIKQLEQQHPHLLKIHAGDAIVGTPYYKFFQGESDARAMNIICFDAFVLGNHEFDSGDDGLKVFLDYLRASPDCQTPVLSANVHPAKGTPLDGAPAGKPYVVPYVVKELGGVKVGMIGITVVGKTKNASHPLPTTQFEDEIKAAQRTIDTLKSQGVKHIVLITHIGFDADLQMAKQLQDVDVIVGGDSHTLVGDFSEIGLSGRGTYPAVAHNKGGGLVCIVQAWEYAKAVGLLTVKFDDSGHVISCGGQASVVLGPEMKKRGQTSHWVDIQKEEVTTLLSSLRNPDIIQLLEPDAEVLRALAPFEQQYVQRTSTVIGKLAKDESLCLTRVPGSANRGTAICAGVSDRAGGADIAQWVAEAYRLAPEQGPADIGLTNAGGVRIALETDGVEDLLLTEGMVYKIQPFTNELYVLRLSGQQIVDVLEEAVSNWKDQRHSDGSHPYASGLRWHLDLSKPAGQRFSQIQHKDHATGQWLPLRPNDTYSLVTMDYLAEGFEGYKTLAKVCSKREAGLCSTAGSVFADESLIRHIKSRQAAGARLTRPACADYSHQQVITAEGRALRSCN